MYIIPKIIYTTACVAPNRRMLKLLDRSAEVYGIDLQPYGIGPNSTYRGWSDIKIVEFCKAAHQWLDAGYTHCFYTDGRDSFFLANYYEIEHNYSTLGSPPYLISCEDHPYPFGELGVAFPDPGHPWRYLGAGQFMGEIKYMIDLWERLRPIYGCMPFENHDQGWLQLAWAEENLDKDTFILDQGCKIFQTASVSRHGLEEPNYFELAQLEIKSGRVFNPATKSWPCALHLPGGYSDPETGKESVLIPLWEAIRVS